MGRAVAHARTLDARLRDPTALPLLSAAARERVERLVARKRPRGVRELAGFAHLHGLANMMAVRTLAVDEAISNAAAPQLVILGAGLDGRAFRMPELRDAVVFEVDHPDSQRTKQARSQPLTAAARQLHFVPVDFARDSLDQALQRAGHDPDKPTMFVWEGVVMYLTREAIDATLAVVRERAAPGSQLSIVYHAPNKLMMTLVSTIVRALGEPLQSEFSRQDMQQLLARHGFRVQSDYSVPEFARLRMPALARAVAIAKHLRIVTAQRE